jgi:hypothetical protein
MGLGASHVMKSPFSRFPSSKIIYKVGAGFPSCQHLSSHSLWHVNFLCRASDPATLLGGWDAPSWDVWRHSCLSSELNALLKYSRTFCHATECAQTRMLNRWDFRLCMKTTAFCIMSRKSRPTFQRYVRTMEVVRTCETSIYFYEATGHHISEACHLQLNIEHWTCY